MRITQIKRVGPSVFMEAINIKTGQIYPLQLVSESKIRPIDNELETRNYFHWWVEAHRIGALGLANEPISSTIANIKPEAYQLDAVYRYLLHPGPIRHLLADDPGTGKTIMAIMLMLELAARQPGMRILLSVPPGLISKWQKELVQKFGILDFRVIEGREFKSEVHNPWLDSDRIIISSFTGRMPKPVAKLQEPTVHFDLTIVDEAHRFASPDAEWSFPYLKAIAEHSHHVLFMTATPHAGKREQFTAFINLLLPGLILDAYDDAEAESISTLMIRRVKEELKSATGEPIFKRRDVQTVKIPMTEEERDIYRLLNEYLDKGYPQHHGDRRTPISLVRPTYQRRHASSLAALQATLQRRMRIVQGNNDIEVEEDIESGEAVTDSYSPEERQALEVPVTDEAQRGKEIEYLNALLSLINEVGVNNTGKWQVLRDRLLEELNSPQAAQEKQNKLLIFTEHRDTALWLVDTLRQEGWKVTCIHGGLKMPMEEPATYETFKNEGEAPDRLTAQYWFEHDASILVATDAAGEGIDLQFCRLMINYDMPWNPNRLEQRMGRIHRYGQTKDVLIYNFCVKGTIEDDVQIIIQDKLKTISEDYAKIHERGAELVYDVISTVLNESEITQFIRKLYDLPEEEREAEKARFANEFGARQKEAVENAKKMCQSSRLRPLLEGSAGDRSGGRDDFRTTPEYTELFFRSAWHLLGGQIIREDPDPKTLLGYNVWKLSWDGDWPDWVKKICIPCREHTTLYVNFDVVKKNILLLHPGVALFDQVVEMVKIQLASSRRYDVAIDSRATVPYCLYFFKYEFVNGLSQTIAKFVSAIRQMPDPSESNPEQRWHFEECADARVHFHLHMAPSQVYESLTPHLSEWINETEAESWLINRLPQYSTDWQKEFQSIDRDQRDILKSKLDQVWKRRSAEKNVMNQMRLNEIIEQIKQSLRQKEQELHVTFRLPEYLGALLVLPAKNNEQSTDIPEVIDNYLELLQNLVLTSEGYLNQGEIERIAMEEVERYEEGEGRSIADRSRTNRIGYDILSIGPNEVREIEVKGHAYSGDINLEENEKVHLQQHAQNAWVYVVEGCATPNRQVYARRNLFSGGIPQKYESTRTWYRIPREKWLNSETEVKE